MSLSYRQQWRLRLIGADLRRSDPHVGAMFGIFGRLYPDQDMPDWEQAAQGRLRRVAAWIVTVFAATAVAITVMLGKAVTLATSRRRTGAQAPATKPERARPRSDGQA
jgi:anti-sigma-K factor RskA